jgi:hypothetical protein
MKLVNVIKILLTCIVVGSIVFVCCTGCSSCSNKTTDVAAHIGGSDINCENDSIKCQLNILQVFHNSDGLDSINIVESWVDYKTRFETYNHQEDLRGDDEYELVNDPYLDGFQMYHSVMAHIKQEDIDAGLSCYYILEIVIYLE